MLVLIFASGQTYDVLRVSPYINKVTGAAFNGFEDKWVRYANVICEYDGKTIDNDFLSRWNNIHSIQTRKLRVDKEIMYMFVINRWKGRYADALLHKKWEPYLETSYVVFLINDYENIFSFYADEMKINAIYYSNDKTDIFKPAVKTCIIVKTVQGKTRFLFCYDDDKRQLDFAVRYFEMPTDIWNQLLLK